MKNNQKVILVKMVTPQITDEHVKLRKRFTCAYLSMKNQQNLIIVQLLKDVEYFLHVICHLRSNNWIIRWQLPQVEVQVYWLLHESRHVASPRHGIMIDEFARTFHSVSVPPEKSLVEVAWNILKGRFFVK